MENSLFLKGILYLILIPLLLAVFAILVLFLSLVDVLTLSVIVFYSLVIYFFVLFGKNAYTDSEVLGKVKIPNAPKEIKVLLRKRTRGTKRLVNADLISILGAKKTLCQTDLVKQIKKRNIDLSPPAIVKYISELEDSGIFASRKGAHKIEYYLTPKGEWCYMAVRKCFPNRFIFFVIRHFLKFRNLPNFPQNQEISN